MNWKEDTEADIVQTNMDLKGNSGNIKAKSAMDDRDRNDIGPEDYRVDLEEASKTDEDVPRGDVWRTVPKVPKKFTISLDRKEWHKIRPSIDFSKLRPPWTHYVYKAFKTKNIKAAHSRKRNSPY